VFRASNRLDFVLTPSAAGENVTIAHSLTGPLLLAGGGELRVSDGVVDSGAGLGNAAITANEGRLEMDRVTVFGTVRVLVLEASEVIFNDEAVAIDRFHGCVRYSRVTSGSQLPRVHRVVEDIRPRYVSVDRHHAAHARLAETCPREILRGAEDGSEMGAFRRLQQAQRYEAFVRRLMEYTPAGLQTGLIRMD
jgi:hypothetical protein